MTHRLPRLVSWPTILIGIVLLRVALLMVDSESQLASFRPIVYFLVLLLATGFAARNAIQKTLGDRPFWAFLALACGLWALDQWLFLYYTLGLHIDVPDNSIADPVLFLHIVPLMAAIATLPHRNPSDRKLSRSILNSFLLFFFWGFLYVYTVFPYQYLLSNTTIYALRFDTLYLIENWILVLALGVLSLRTQSPWRAVYLHLLGASALYALSSAVANMAIDSGGYINGKLYGLGLTASACWFVWISLRARRSPAVEASTARSDSSKSSLASAWAMLVVVMISVPVVWELFRKDEATPGVRRFRLLAAVAAIVCMACLAYIEEYLAKSELASHLGLANEQFRLAVEASKSVGWEWDLKTGRLYWFGDLQNMFGIASETFTGRPEDFYLYVHPDDRQSVGKAVADARQNRKQYVTEFRVVRSDGAVRWVTAKGKFYYSTHGDPERMLGMALDITDRKRGEESLHLFRALIDQSNDAIEVVDPETSRFLDANEKAYSSLGYSREEFLALTVCDIDPVAAGSRAKVLEELQKSGFVIAQRVHRRKDGSTFPVEINVKSVHLDREYIVTVARDITERNRAQEALRESEDKLRLLLDSTAEAIYGIDVEGRCTFCNPACLRALGYEKTDELLGKSMHELMHHTRADGQPYPEETCRIHGVARTGEGVHVDDEVLWRSNGTSFPAEYSSFPQRKGTDLVGAVVAFVDITERKLAEAALASVSRRLIDAQEQERSRIGRELHDDIGQRLAMLAIELEQFQEGPPDLPAEVRNRMRGLHKQTSEIASDIQSLSHELHSSKLEYLGIAAAMGGFCKEFGEQQKVEVDFKAHDLPSTLPPDVSLCLFRVLQEGLHNAARHSRVRHFEARLWATSKDIHLTVRDSGVGFNEEGAKQGRGLGLISMKERLKLVDGTFAIESQLMRGTTIHAFVPLGASRNAVSKPDKQKTSQ